MTQTILVTGIGGNVAQGILRNVRAAFPGIRLVGTDIRDVTAGHHFCDAAHRVPYCYDDGFAEQITRICQREQVDLVIPGTDYEVVSLGELAAQLPTIVGSSPDVARGFVDKLKTYELFRERGMPFAAACLPAQHTGQFEHVVVKPREGRGSRGIHLDPADPSSFDETYMVQKRIVGQEITTAFYVTRRGDLHGHITLERELVDGATERCSVTTAYDALVEPLVDALTAHFAIQGPCNVQSIVTEAGAIVPFEINCRYSGTNSIRSQFGFEDVRWGVEEYLLDEQPSPWTLRPGAAVRTLMDIIYPDRTLRDISAGSEGSYIF